MNSCFHFLILAAVHHTNDFQNMIPYKGIKLTEAFIRTAYGFNVELLSHDGVAVCDMFTVGQAGTLDVFPVIVIKARLAEWRADLGEVLPVPGKV